MKKASRPRRPLLYVIFDEVQDLDANLDHYVQPVNVHND
jgi:hypothetical protein